MPPSRARAKTFASLPFEAAGLNLERVWRVVTGESKE
jgi:hypothetical protein